MKKVKIFLLVLNKNQIFLQFFEGKMVLKKIKWVLVCKERFLNYFGFLVWKGDFCNFCVFLDMCDAVYVVLVGFLFFFVESVYVNLEQAFSIFIKFIINVVLKYFKIVVDWYILKIFSDEDYYQF